METEVLKIIKDPLLEIGIAIDQILYLKEDNVNFLRVIIDKDPYVDIDDCVKASKIINPIMDSVNIIKESYILDVCSKEKGEI